jgi:hypothetical protein
MEGQIETLADIVVHLRGDFNARRRVLASVDERFGDGALGD